MDVQFLGSMVKGKLLVPFAAISLLSLATTGSSSSCRSLNGFAFHYYICEGFKSIRDFVLIEHARVQRDTYFVLKDSLLDYLPSTAFAGTSMSVLEISNVSLTTYADPRANSSSPFEPVKNSLRKFILNKQKKPLEDWGLLGSVGGLETLKLLKIEELNLTSDFNKLPLGINEIHIEEASIGRVGQDWVSELSSLRAIGVKRTTLKTITRSMLPTSAPNLAIIDLTENELSSLPEDLTFNMPALKTLDVGFNSISTLHEETFAPVKRNGGFANMNGNPLVCDCRLTFLLTCPRSWNYYMCSDPESSEAVPIASIMERHTCNGTRRSE